MRRNYAMLKPCGFCKEAVLVDNLDHGRGVDRNILIVMDVGYNDMRLSPTGRDVMVELFSASI